MSTALPSPSGVSRSGFLHIAETLRRAILRGHLHASQQLPPIAQLAREYRTTTVTVRRALRQLEEEGLLRVEHGVGTFVRDWSAAHDLLQLPSFSDEMAERMLAAKTEVRERQQSVCHAAAARALGLKPNAPLAMLARVRMVETAPIAFQRSYVPGELAAVVTELTEADSLYEQIRLLTNRVPLSSDERLRAVALPPDEARELHREAGEVGWRAERVTYDAGGEPLVYDEAFFAGDQIALRVRRHGRQTTVELEWDDV